MSFDQIWSMIVGILIVSSPLIITALGGMFSEKSGVINIGLEGIMTFSAFLTSVGIIMMEQSFHVIGVPALFIGLLFGVVGGLIFAFFHGILTIYFDVDQIVSGTAINIIGLGLSLSLTELLFNSGETLYKQSFSVRIFSIPILIFFILFLVFLSNILLNKTKWGLRVKSCGENPESAKSVGLNVKLIRLQAVLLSGVLGAIGGASIIILSSGNFSASTISGKGFIALAVLIFGGWRAFGILGAGLLFGFLSQLGIIINTLGLGKISSDLYSSMPIVVPLISIFIIIGLVILIIISNVKIINIFAMLLIYILTLNIFYQKILYLLFSQSISVPSVYYTILPYVMTIVALIYYSKDKLEPSALGKPYNADIN